MQFLKEKSKIEAWLKKYEITQYTLLADERYGFVVNVDGHVELSGNKLKEIPVKFNTVGGDFTCSSNQLTNLEFCPKLVNGDFHCYGNQLTSLKFCPQTVNGGFYCDNNRRLGDIQKITDFQTIYLEHKKWHAENLYDKLDTRLISKVLSSRVKI